MTQRERVAGGDRGIERVPEDRRSRTAVGNELAAMGGLELALLREFTQVPPEIVERPARTTAATWPQRGPGLT